MSSIQGSVEYNSLSLNKLIIKVIQEIKNNKIQAHYPSFGASIAEALAAKANSSSRKKTIASLMENSQNLVKKGKRNIDKEEDALIIKGMNGKEEKSIIIKEKKDKEEESIIIKGKKAVDNIKRNIENIPKSLKEEINKEDGENNVQIGYFGLITKTKKKITKDKLVTLYYKGIYRKPIRFIRECFRLIGIKKKYVRNISFVSTDLCELIILKKYEKAICSTMEYFDDINLLKCYDPLKCQDNSMEEIKKTEHAFLKRICGIIERKKCPDYIKDYCLDWIEKTKFKSLNIINNKGKTSTEKSIPPIFTSIGKDSIEGVFPSFSNSNKIKDGNDKVAPNTDKSTKEKSTTKTDERSKEKSTATTDEGSKEKSTATTDEGSKEKSTATTDEGSKEKSTAKDAKDIKDNDFKSFNSLFKIFKNKKSTKEYFDEDTEMGLGNNTDVHNFDDTSIEDFTDETNISDTDFVDESDITDKDYIEEDNNNPKKLNYKKQDTLKPKKNFIIYEFATPQRKSTNSNKISKSQKNNNSNKSTLLNNSTLLKKNSIFKKNGKFKKKAKSKKKSNGVFTSSELIESTYPLSLPEEVHDISSSPIKPIDLTTDPHCVSTFVNPTNVSIHPNVRSTNPALNPNNNQ